MGCTKNSEEMDPEVTFLWKFSKERDLILKVEHSYINIFHNRLEVIENVSFF